MFYNPWKENIFGGIEKEQNLYERGYTITKESATCMVIIFIMLFTLLKSKKCNESYK